MYNKCIINNIYLYYKYKIIIKNNTFNVLFIIGSNKTINKMHTHPSLHCNK